MSDGENLSIAVQDGDRRALARLITRIESTRDEHRSEAEAALNDLLPKTGRSVRVGISGVPGVGKSSFIETFGLHLIDNGHRVAVLAVDPSSPKTGGSILGDKTRMEQLARHPDAFIRPSPSGGTMGGIARRTRETILAVEAARFDIVLIETVGVGQSEYAVADMADMFVLLVAPGGGDDLQGIKKGIVEMADLLVVTKNDGDLMPAAARAFQDYKSAIHMLGSNGPWMPRVLRTSAHSGDGISDVRESIEDFTEIMREAGLFDARRADQAAKWMWEEVTTTLLAQIRRQDDSASSLEDDVRAGRQTPLQAARAILNRIGTRPDQG